MKTKNHNKVGLIIIGSEILKGIISEANLKTLTKWLLPFGFEVDRALIIDDEMSKLEKAFLDFRQTYPLTITCGGLGPTLDDLTKQALAKHLNQEILENPTAQEMVTKQYARIDRVWTKDLNDYHMIPKGVLPLDNPVGLAVGFYVPEDKNLGSLYAFPGVPREFKAMLKAHINLKGSALNTFSIRTYKVPEEEIFKTLSPTLWQCLEEYGKLSSLPRITGVDLVVYLRVDLDPKNAQIEIMKRSEVQPLIPYIWHIGDEELEELVILEAKKKKVSIALAESCTGGLVAKKLTSIPGSSEVFLGSAVTYANQAKSNILNVEESLIKNHGAVSLEVAQAMAFGAKTVFNANIAVSTTGIAGPGGGTQEKPVGTVFIGTSSDKKSQAKQFYFRGEREALQERFATAALFKMLELIREN